MCHHIQTTTTTTTTTSTRLENYKLHEKNGQPICCVYLDETKNTTEPEDADDSEQRRRNGKLVEDILHNESDYRARHQAQIKQVPWQRKIMMTQSNHLDNGLCFT